MPIEVIKFPKKCPHGQPMRLVIKLTRAWWYEPIDCQDCRAEEDKSAAEDEANVEAFIERINQRKERR